MIERTGRRERKSSGDTVGGRLEEHAELLGDF
jgi:hypothetical protein